MFLDIFDIIFLVYKINNNNRERQNGGSPAGAVGFKDAMGGGPPGAATSLRESCAASDQCCHPARTKAASLQPC